MLKSLHSGFLGGLLSIVLSIAMPPTALAQVSPPVMSAEQVSPHVWMVEGLSALGNSANQNFISNAAFVVTPAGVVVIDALGSPALAEQLITLIKRISNQPITHVIVTHYHADHIYGLQTFKAAGAHIVASSAAQPYLNSELAQQRLFDSRITLKPWVNESTHIVPADEWLSGSTTLNVGGVELVIQPVGPSHTPEDMVVYVPQDKVLMAGDLVFRRRIPYVGQADSGHWIEALDTLLRFDAAVVVPGHGPVSKAAREDMQLTRNYLHHLRAMMGPAAQAMEPFEDAYLAADWSRFEALPLFGVANRMNAYNTYLQMEREAKP